VDPIEAGHAQRLETEREAPRAITFSQCAENFIASHEAGWRNPKHRQQWRNTIQTYAAPTIGDVTVADIDVAAIMRILEPIWTSKPETASRLRGRLECILNWARVRGFRDGENPARWRGNLDHLLPAKSKMRRVVHHAALPYSQIPSFVAELRQQTTIAARALEFLLLTATRTSETLNAVWDEVDFASRLWAIPAVRMKACREHRVPLCSRSIEILDEMAGLRRSVFIFPGAKLARPLSNMALAMMLRRLGCNHNMTVHGLRSSFRDWAAEQTTFAGDVAEMALAHSIPGAVQRAYRRGDLLDHRRALMEEWAAFCDGNPLQLHAGTTPRLQRVA
jgi:integrase